MARIAVLTLLAVGAALPWGSAAAEEAVMVRCGRDYQAARSAGTLAGADWNRYRVDCAARLKASPTAAAEPTVPAAAPGAATAPAATTGPVAATAPASTVAPAGGMAAMHLRQKRCGAEWTAQKVTLVAQTPGLTWPRYWSLCNGRLKAAGQ